MFCCCSNFLVYLLPFLKYPILSVCGGPGDFLFLAEELEKLLRKSKSICIKVSVNFG